MDIRKTSALNKSRDFTFEKLLDAVSKILEQEQSRSLKK